MFLVISFGKFIRHSNTKGFIDLQVTNEDIANYCGITTRNSVNQVIRGLKEKHIIQVKNNRIIVLDMDYLKQFIE